MNDTLKLRILAGQARDQIRTLSGHSRDADDIRAAAELIKDFERFREIDVAAIAEEIIEGQAKGLAAAKAMLGAITIASRAEQHSSFLQDGH